MADTHDPSQDLRTGDAAGTAAGAPRPSRTGSVSKLGFDDPTLRPLPPEQLEYHAPHTDAHPERHEHSDVPIRPLAISLAAIAFILAGSFVFLYFLFFHYKGQQDALEVKRTNVPDAKPLIEGPRLQGVPGFSDKHPKDELKDQRDAYRAELESYGKTPDGFAQVPVDTAMRLAIERGMFKTAPARHGPGGATTAVLTLPARLTNGTYVISWRVVSSAVMSPPRLIATCWSTTSPSTSSFTDCKPISELSSFMAACSS